MATEVGLAVILAIVMWKVNCQETRLNVVFPQLEKIGSAPDGKNIKNPAMLPPAPGDKDALRLQQLQSEIVRLKGLVKTLVIDDVSGKNDHSEITSSQSVTTAPMISTTQKAKEIVPGGGIGNFFANMGGETNANVNDFDMNSLHSEIEALQKQLSDRDDNNSRNSFINQPMKESPTTYHFHNDRNPPHQSYFDHSAQGDKNPYFYQEGQKFRSAEPSTSETEYNYVVQPLPSQTVRNQIHPVPKISSRVERVKAPKKLDESESLILRHHHSSDYNNRNNGYGDQYIPYPHHRPVNYEDDYKEDKPNSYHSPAYYEAPKYGYEEYYKPHPHHHLETPTYGYGDDFKPHPSSGHHNYETRPEYGPPRYEEVKDYTQPQMYGTTDAFVNNKDKHSSHRLIATGSTSSYSGLTNALTGGGGTSVQNVILQFVLEVVRMIAGGNSAGVVASVLRLPGVFLKSFLQTAGNALAKDGLKGIIAKGIIPLIVLIGANILIIFLTWFMWDDGSCQKNNLNTYDSKY